MNRYRMGITFCMMANYTDCYLIISKGTISNFQVNEVIRIYFSMLSPYINNRTRTKVHNLVYI
jgi:hypothetical protein